MKKLLVVLMLAGCVSPQLQKPFHVSNQDWAQCRYEALKVEASVQNPIIGYQYGQDTLRMCLQIKGY